MLPRPSFLFLSCPFFSFAVFHRGSTVSRDGMSRKGSLLAEAEKTKGEGRVDIKEVIIKYYRTVSPKRESYLAREELRQRRCFFFAI